MRVCEEERVDVLADGLRAEGPAITITIAIAIAIAIGGLQQAQVQVLRQLGEVARVWKQLHSVLVLVLVGRSGGCRSRARGGIRRLQGPPRGGEGGEITIIRGCCFLFLLLCSASFSLFFFLCCCCDCFVVLVVAFIGAAAVLVLHQLVRYVVVLRYVLSEVAVRELHEEADVERLGDAVAVRVQLQPPALPVHPQRTAVHDLVHCHRHRHRNRNRNRNQHGSRSSHRNTHRTSSRTSRDHSATSSSDSASRADTRTNSSTNRERVQEQPRGGR